MGWLETDDASSRNTSTHPRVSATGKGPRQVRAGAWVGLEFFARSPGRDTCGGAEDVIVFAGGPLHRARGANTVDGNGRGRDETLLPRGRTWAAA